MIKKNKKIKFAVLLGGSHFLYGPFISYHESFKSVKKKIGRRDDFCILKANGNELKRVHKNGVSV